MPSYNRLTGENRIELYALKQAGLTQEAIETQLNVHPSTISRELKRNTGLRGYRELLSNLVSNRFSCGGLILV